MVELPQIERDAKMRVCIKISAKGEPHGEYTFRGDTKDELDDNGTFASLEFKRHLDRWKK